MFFPVIGKGWESFFFHDFGIGVDLFNTVVMEMSVEKGFYGIMRFWMRDPVGITGKRHTGNQDVDRHEHNGKRRDDPADFPGDFFNPSG